jgi:hypothetical protein
MIYARKDSWHKKPDGDYHTLCGIECKVEGWFYQVLSPPAGERRCVKCFDALLEVGSLVPGGAIKLSGQGEWVEVEKCGITMTVGEEMPMSRQSAEALVAQAGEALAKFAAREKKYGKDHEDGTVLKFTKFWSAGQFGDPYSYAALRINGRWYLTGSTRRRAASPVTWDDLLLWMDSGEYPVTDLQKATDWNDIEEQVTDVFAVNTEPPH